MVFSILERMFLNHGLLIIRSIFLRSRYYSPGCISIFRSFATLQVMRKPFSISRIFQSKPEILRIEFEDSLATDFYYIWLRDNCNCKMCVQPKTKQKNLDSVSLKLNIAPRFCYITGSGRLKIIWRESYGEHNSYYHPLWLHRYALGFERNLYEVVHDSLPPVTCWTGKHLAENLPEIDYEDVMHSQRGMFLTLDKIHKFGIIFIKNVPREPGEVDKVMNRIANIKRTKWGSSYHIITNDIFEDPSYFPYTDNKLELHTDMNYLESSPGVQAIHCLQLISDNSPNKVIESSSETFFVDGFYIANWLKNHYPIHFQTLVTVPVKFRMLTENMRYMNYQPILKLNRSRDITEVHFNNRMMAPLEGPATSISDFYAARKVFGEIVREQKNQFRRSLKPGDMVILNNRRVLHGRQWFDTRKNRKHLEGCFADMDEILASYRALLKKEKDSKE